MTFQYRALKIYPVHNKNFPNWEGELGAWGERKLQGGEEKPIYSEAELGTDCAEDGC